MKKLLSMLLALSILLTMLPIQTMAEEAVTLFGIKGEIVAFVPLEDTEYTAQVGTPIEGLKLPKTLTAKVRTVSDTVQDSVYGSEYDEILVDIPVNWTCRPEYDMDTEDEYVFTPVIEGYIISAELPKIFMAVSEREEAPILMNAAEVTAVTEHFHVGAGGLTLGGTYYFDLSGEIGNNGIVNNKLPDTTLHYVPFTYVGTINAYSLHGRSGSPTTDPETAASNTTDPNHPIGYRSDRSLLR